MIILFTGNGKGKTTASLGQMLRALGRGKKVLMIQFIKGPWLSGEDYFGKRFKMPGDTFEIKKMGLGFVGILGDKLSKEEHQKAAEAALQFFKEENATGKWDLIVLDEINVAISLGLLEVKSVKDAIRDFPENKLLVLTGRDAHPELVEQCRFGSRSLSLITGANTKAGRTIRLPNRSLGTRLSRSSRNLAIRRPTARGLSRLNQKRLSPFPFSLTFHDIFSIIFLNVRE